MAEVSPVSVSNEREIQPMDLSIEQLNGLKTQHENEIQELQKQAEQLYNANSRFNTAKAVLNDMSKYEDGNTLLMPLNSSLYVPGKIVQPDRVMVELGTGYFCEKTVPDASALIDRKVQLRITQSRSINHSFIHQYH